MQDTAGSHRLLLAARGLLVGKDETLENAVRHVGILAEYEKTAGDDDDNEEEEEENFNISTYTRPRAWVPSSTPSNLVALQMRWATLQQQSNGLEQFARLACVTTNELEGVFLLERDSSKQLARCGLMLNSITGISSRSRHKDPAKILSIIKNTEKCYQTLNSVVSEGAPFTKDFLKSMHRILLDRDNMEMTLENGKYGSSWFAVVTPMGTFREVPCFAGHRNDGYETRFCPSPQIEAEMDFFFTQVELILGSTDLDPYRATAFMQHLFLRIHPFGDGNGRIARLVSSIPLLREGLPPVIVSLKRKKKYFKALKIADDTDDIDPLAAFLQKESFKAMKDMLEYDHSNAPPSIVLKKGRRRHLEERFLRQPSDSESGSDSSSSSEE